jgi:hypothetical protein
MAARKQFINRPTPNESLLKLLESKRHIEVTEEELAEQRISFAYGNAMNTESITKASVIAASKKIRLAA